MESTLHWPAGRLADGRYQVSLTPGRAGWSYAGLRVLGLPAGGSCELSTGAAEMLVLPLAGSATVHCAGQRLELAGRPSVFAGVTDFAYLPPGCAAGIRSEHGGRFALPSAWVRGAAGQPAAAAARPPGQARYGTAAGVPVELRGPVLPAGERVLHAGRVPGHPADGLRGAHPGRQLVVVPAAQA